VVKFISADCKVRFYPPRCFEFLYPIGDASRGNLLGTSEGQATTFLERPYEGRDIITTESFLIETTVTSGPSTIRSNVDVGWLTYQQAYDQRSG